MAEAQNGNWSLEEIDLLICLVRANDLLYNQALPGYSNRDVTEKLWSCIAARVKKTPHETIKKWQVLRGGYRKRRKDYLSAPSGSACIKKKKWTYYDSLQFLDPYLEDRHTLTNVPKEVSVFDPDISSPIGSVCNESLSQTYTMDDEEIVFQVVNEEEEEEDTPLNTDENTPVKKTKRKVNPREAADLQMAEYLNILKTKRAKTDKKSSMEYFLLSLVDEAEALSPQHQTQFKIKVLELLQDLGN